MRILVVSCAARKPLQDLWLAIQRAHWPDCPYKIDILSPVVDAGWNANLITYLRSIDDDLIAVFLDDHFICEAKPGEITENMATLVTMMTDRPDIGMCKLQAGNAAPPEIPFPLWPRLAEYDRAHHPFKRTNLVPTLFRREWLLRLASAVLDRLGPSQDIGRNGAINFEVTGTLLTEDPVAWPEKMLGIHRPNPDGGGGQSILTCMDNDAVREGKLKPMQGQEAETLLRLRVGIEGLEAFA